MYPARPANYLTGDEIVSDYGQHVLDKLLSANVEPTSRIIDDCYNVVEYRATEIITDEDGFDAHISIQYLQDKDVVAQCDDLGSLDWVDPVFYVN